MASRGPHRSGGPAAPHGITVEAPELKISAPPPGDPPPSFGDVLLGLILIIVVGSIVFLVTSGLLWDGIVAGASALSIWAGTATAYLNDHLVDPKSTVGGWVQKVVPDILAWFGGIFLVSATALRKRIALLFRSRRRLEEVENKIIYAPSRFISRLDGLIETAIKEGPEKAFINARAVIAARDHIARAMYLIGSSLNTEIDHLSSMCKIESDQFEMKKRKPVYGWKSDEEIYSILLVLSKSWDIKRQSIMVGIRQILNDAELLDE